MVRLKTSRVDIVFKVDEVRLVGYPLLEDCTIPLIFTDNVYIFTGLSSRGLLYHGLYGDLLTNVILGNENENETLVGQEKYNLDWWRDSKRKAKV